VNLRGDAKPDYYIVPSRVVKRLGETTPFEVEGPSDTHFRGEMPGPSRRMRSVANSSDRATRTAATHWCRHFV